MSRSKVRVFQGSGTVAAIVFGERNKKRKTLTRNIFHCSLGWTELMTTMAKMIYTYDLELVDQELDWHGDSRMHTVWEKPALMVKVSPRK